MWTRLTSKIHSFDNLQLDFLLWYSYVNFKIYFKYLLTLLVCRILLPKHLFQTHAQCILDHLREQRKCHQVSLVGNQKQPPQSRLRMASWKSNLWPRQFLTSTTMDDPCFGHNSASRVCIRDWISKLLNFLLIFVWLWLMSLPKSCLNKFPQANGLIITNTCSK